MDIIVVITKIHSNKTHGKHQISTTVAISLKLSRKPIMCDLNSMSQICDMTRIMRRKQTREEISLSSVVKRRAHLDLSSHIIISPLMYMCVRS